MVFIHSRQSFTDASNHFIEFHVGMHRGTDADSSIDMEELDRNSEQIEWFVEKARGDWTGIRDMLKGLLQADASF